MMDNIDYSKCNNEPVITWSCTESEYKTRLKLRLAMEDVLKAYHSAKNSEDFGEDVIEIIEAWGVKDD